MKCKEAKILLSAAIDGELSPNEELALGKHVTSCAGCAKDKAEFVRLSETMPLWAEEETSPWLAEKFSCKLAELQEAGSVRPPQRRYRWGTLSAATAGLAAAVLAIGLLIHSSVPPANESPMQAKVKPPTKIVQPVQQPDSAADTLVADNAVKPPPPVVRNTGGRRNLGLRHVATASKDRPKPLVNAAPAPTPPSAPEPASVNLAYADSTRAAAMVASSTISENLGEASLAMNDTIERVRGNLQKSVDLIVSQPPVPETDSTHSDGGI